MVEITGLVRQSPWRHEWKGEVSIMGSGMALNISTFFKSQLSIYLIWMCSHCSSISVKEIVLRAYACFRHGAFLTDREDCHSQGLHFTSTGWKRSEGRKRLFLFVNQDAQAKSKKKKKKTRPDEMGNY